MKKRILSEVWQKWCELGPEKFDEWLHNEMHKKEVSKSMFDVLNGPDGKPNWAARATLSLVILSILVAIPFIIVGVLTIAYLYKR